jgi:hypothetical protein
LSLVFFEPLGADGGVLFAVAAAVASAAATSRGFVLLVFLQLLQSFLDLVSPVLSVLRVISSAVSALISATGVFKGVVEVGFEEAEGSGQVFGIVEEYVAISWSGGFKDHRGSARRECDGEWSLDQFRDVLVVFSIGERDVCGDDLRELVSSGAVVFGCVFELGCQVVKAGGCVEEGLVDVFLRHVGDGGEVFDVDEAVGHCKVRLAEEVKEEVVVVVGVAEG